MGRLCTAQSRGVLPNAPRWGPAPRGLQWTRVSPLGAPGSPVGVGAGEGGAVVFGQRNCKWVKQRPRKSV